VKKTGIILMLAILLPLSAFADKKKRPPQDNTDWLNAPTPDGSPTLKQTSDWLASVIGDYGNYECCGFPFGRIVDVGIDNQCTFQWREVSDSTKHPLYMNFSVPLGAVTSVEIQDNNGATQIWIRTGDIGAIRGSGQAVSATPIVGIDLTRIQHLKPDVPVPQTAQEMAPRIQKALQHAVDLCRSTHQEPAQSNEPF